MPRQVLPMSGAVLPPGSGGPTSGRPPEATDPDRFGREDEARIAGTLGIVSLIALAASFLWAHHWGPLAFTIVGVWGLSTLGALIMGCMAIRSRRGLAMLYPGRGLATLALLCVTVSAIVVAFTGASYAAGFVPSARAAAAEQGCRHRSRPGSTAPLRGSE
jgi:drug/metabolite transporter (DMT)-like permease